MPAGIYLDEMFGHSVEQHLLTRAAPVGLRIVRAMVVQPAGRDTELLAYAANHDLVLVTRNLQDFLRLNEVWTALRDWGLMPRPHAGILISVGLAPDLDWADRVMDLLLHPKCPRLDDQLLLWRLAPRRWESDHPYARRRRRPLIL
jgi:hypothetical protein